MYRLLLTFLLGLLPIVEGSDGSNYFSSPASSSGINPVYTLGDKLEIAWTTTLGTFNMSFWQQSLVEVGASSQGNVYSKIHSADQVTNFTWVVQLYGFDLDYSNVFFFWINEDQPSGFTSTYFNITEPSSTSTSTTTSATSTSTSTSTSSSSLEATSTTHSDSADTAAAAAAESSSSSSSSSSITGLTTTGQIALGVGIGLGVPILGAMAVLVWFKARQSKNAQTATATTTIYPGTMIQGPPSPPKEVYGSDPMSYWPELPTRQDHQ